MKRWKAFWGDLVNLVLPPACLVCGARIDDQAQVICSDCETGVRPPAGSRCPVCGEAMSSENCANCQNEVFAFDSYNTMFGFQGTVRDLVHELKYEGFISPAGYFAAHMSELLQDDEQLRNSDLVCSVPLHRVRKRERGYNQSELIAYAAATLAGLPYAQPVTRNTYTRSQTKLSRAGRKKNLQGAFTVHEPELVRGKKVILVDDVFTTGTTLNEVAKELKNAGAEKVMAVTVARA